jgi:ankyrin repeat protein
MARPPCWIAVGKGKTAIASLLLDRGADLNTQEPSGAGMPEPTGQTLLMLAASHNRAPVARLLLDRGLDVNAQSVGGTALIGAVGARSLPLVTLLLDRGADVNARSDTGMTALSCAAHFHHEAIIKRLQAHGAKGTP